MIIVISPSKTQNFSPSAIDHHSQAVQLSDSQLLIETLQKLSANNLGALMKISDKLSQLNYQRFQSFKLPFNLTNAKQALFAFKGDVYNGIDSDNYSTADLDFAQNHLRILSGLYGVLKPLDLIQAYRLEMGTRLKNTRGSQLYQFWDKRITEQLNLDLLAENTSAPLLLNLASNEYYKAVKEDYLNAPVLHIKFKEYKNGKYRVIGIHAKRARGKMVNFMIKQRVNTPAGLKQFKESNYCFNPDLSDESTWVFSR